MTVRVHVAALPIPERHTLDPTTSHHLERVLRLRPGATLTLHDGRGTEQTATVVAIRPVRVAPVGPPRPVPPPVPLHLALPVLKHQAMDRALRMATEAGVSAFHPLLTERTVAKGERRERWERIVVSATNQCGRAHVPVLHPLLPLETFLDDPPTPSIVFGAPGAPAPVPAGGPCTLVIGPEGGLAPREVDRLLDQGATPIGLGPYILRAETAAAVGTALLRRSDGSGVAHPCSPG